MVAIGQRFPGHGDDDPQSPAMSKFIPDQCPILPEVPIWLVVGPPLSKIWKSIGMIIPNIWENRKCSKPPTSHKMIGAPGVARLEKVPCRKRAQRFAEMPSKAVTRRPLQRGDSQGYWPWTKTSQSWSLTSYKLVRTPWDENTIYKHLYYPEGGFNCRRWLMIDMHHWIEWAGFALGT